MMVSPIYVANNLIIRAKKNDEPMTHLKLQKLLYIIYARFLAMTEANLYYDCFVAWQYGPVLPEVYEAFKSYGAKNINKPQMQSDGKITVVVEKNEFGACINEVWEKFGHASASDLVALTHGNGSAWAKTVNRDQGLYGGFLENAHIKEDGNEWFK